uniref:Testicular haploid expressed gene protein-like n=1 Tax=Ornithorhynchus anatinus TaxID=9258 RepID=A0A6I8N8B6_ORNAN
DIQRGAGGRLSPGVDTTHQRGSSPVNVWVAVKGRHCAHTKAAPCRAVVFDDCRGCLALFLLLPPCLRIPVDSAPTEPAQPGSPSNPGAAAQIRHSCSIQLGRIRDRQLSKPKREWGSPVRRLDWGNQETIRSVSASALRAGLSERLEFLARPKKVHSSLCRPKYLYSCGRESSIWKYPPGVTFSYPSERILKLAEPKRVHESYLKLRPRSSPEWPVSRAALTCEASEHLKRLSQAKLQHQDYCPPRTVETQIPRTALRAQASQRLTSLSQPKVKSESLVLDLGRKEEPIRWVSKTAREAKPTPRTIKLAQARPLPDGYLPIRDAQWLVSPAAMRAFASPRTVQLSAPIRRCLWLPGRGWGQGRGRSRGGVRRRGGRELSRAFSLACCAHSVIPGPLFPTTNCTLTVSPESGL